MPTFSPGTVHTAHLPVVVTPAGLACTLEFYLVKYGSSSKVATSGNIAFTSTGAEQRVNGNLSMPSVMDGYYVFALLAFPGIGYSFNPWNKGAIAVLRGYTGECIDSYRITYYNSLYTTWGQTAAVEYLNATSDSSGIAVIQSTYWIKYYKYSFIAAGNTAKANLFVSRVNTSMNQTQIYSIYLQVYNS
ncbi:MAG: hypothetical protein PHI12_11320 [Dehalococcoidales bacterium]|nr:hypothetical protein [Dehalococcoidales bacterium]